MKCSVQCQNHDQYNSVSSSKLEKNIIALEDLLCDEVLWESDHDEGSSNLKGYGYGYEDSEEALVICLERELSYMPEPAYLHYLQTNHLVFARFRAVQWLIKTCTRLNFSIGTVFNAVNYLDRFLPMSQCHGWKHWMVELLSITCLSIASKFNETSLHSFDELQMEDLEHYFKSSTIQQMELMVLQALEWRLGSTTPYSYIELMITSNDDLNYNLHMELINQVNKTLLKAISDFKLLPYPPSVIAISAVWCSLEELNIIPSSYNEHLSKIMKLINQDHEDDIMECRGIMKGYNNNLKVLDSDYYYYYYPSSPVTVLLMDQRINDCRQVDLSLFKMPLPASNVHNNINGGRGELSSGNKRKREEEEEEEEIL